MTSIARAAHPRSRGENLSDFGGCHEGSGSSPLTRGKRSTTVRRSPCCGLIPAHAGKTMTTGMPFEAGRAHPRSRGENPCHDHAEVSSVGSSPLTRGKRKRHKQDQLTNRLIPAHAGKTCSHAARASARTAHPRSRGENQQGIHVITDDEGSSPLTRGKHFPTCAFTAQIDQILETLELAVSSGSYSVWVACATDAPQDQVRSIGLVLPSSRGAS